MMHERGGAEPPIYLAFNLPPPKTIEAGFADMTLNPADRNRLLPSIVALGGQPTDAERLCQDLVDRMRLYASTKPFPRVALRALLDRLPEFTERLVVDSERLVEALEVCEQVLADPEIEEMLAAMEPQPITEPETSTPTERVGAPRRIKELLDRPEQQLSAKQARILDKWRRFSQRDQARLQAEREQELRDRD